MKPEGVHLPADAARKLHDWIQLVVDSFYADGIQKTLQLLKSEHRKENNNDTDDDKSDTSESDDSEVHDGTVASANGGHNGKSISKVETHKGEWDEREEEARLIARLHGNNETQTERGGLQKSSSSKEKGVGESEGKRNGVEEVEEERPNILGQVLALAAQLKEQAAQLIAQKELLETQGLQLTQKSTELEAVISELEEMRVELEGARSELEAVKTELEESQQAARKFREQARAPEEDQELLSKTLTEKDEMISNLKEELTQMQESSNTAKETAEEQEEQYMKKMSQQRSYIFKLEEDVEMFKDIPNH